MAPARSEADAPDQVPGEPEVDVVIEAAGWEAVTLSDLATEAARATLAHLDLPSGAEISLLATDDATVARLNADFRGKSQPTNVLSWPAAHLAPPRPGAAPPPPQPDPTGALFLGDIALAYETCVREAADARKSLNAHTTHLIVHAILHLLGYDHICDEDADLMERLEADILSSLGMANPYSGVRP